MGKSSRVLGYEVGLNSQEMNILLKQEGFLSGESGAYTVTEKGRPYATEKYFHSGPGGYSCYNADWETRTWDDGILDAIDINKDKIKAAQKAFAAAQAEKRIARQLAIEQAERNFRSTGSAYIHEKPVIPQESSGLSTGAKVGIGIGIGAVAVYGIYKASPYIAKWWTEKVVPRFKRKEADNLLMK